MGRAEAIQIKVVDFQRYRCLSVYSKGGEPIYYHGSHKLRIIAGGPQKQLN